MPNSHRVLSLVRAIQNSERTAATARRNIIDSYNSGAGSRESSMNMSRTMQAHRIFATLRDHYQSRFNQFAPHGSNEARIRAIFREIKQMILNIIIEDASEPNTVRNWVRSNINILLDENHPRYRQTLAESRNYLGSYTSANQRAWRSFDPEAPCHARWPNLFIDSIFNYDVRERLAYYYLAITDNVIPENIRPIMQNMFIGALSNIRRAHNLLDNGDDGLIDNISCRPGHITRIAQIGNAIEGPIVGVLGNNERYRHPIAYIPEHISLDKAVERQVNNFVLNSLRLNYANLSPSEKERYRNIIMKMGVDNTLEDIQNNIVNYSDEELTIYLEVLDNIGIEVNRNGFETYLEPYKIKESVFNQVIRDNLEILNSIGQDYSLDYTQLDQAKQIMLHMLLFIVNSCSNSINMVFPPLDQVNAVVDLQDSQQVTAPADQTLDVLDLEPRVLEEQILGYFIDPITQTLIADPIYFVGSNDKHWYDRASINDYFDNKALDLSNLQQLENFVGSIGRNLPENWEEKNILAPAAISILIEQNDNLHEIGDPAHNNDNKYHSFNAITRAAHAMLERNRDLSNSQIRSPLTRGILDRNNMESGRDFMDICLVVIHYSANQPNNRIRDILNQNEDLRDAIAALINDTTQQADPDGLTNEDGSPIIRGTRLQIAEQALRDIIYNDDIASPVSRSQKELLRSWGIGPNLSRVVRSVPSVAATPVIAPAVVAPPAAVAPVALVPQANINATLALNLTRRLEGRAAIGARSRYTLNANNTPYNGPYSDTIDFPQNMPVIHPYDPIDGVNPVYDGGIPYFPIVATINSGNINLPAGIRQLLAQHNIGINNLTVNFCAQSAPWLNNQPLLLRPHAWLHQNAPFNGNYNQGSNIVVGVASIDGRFSPLINEHVSTHGEGGNVVYSPNNMGIAGVDNLAQSHRLYSFCFNPATGQATVTLHWLLNQDDYEVLNMALVNNQVSLNEVANLEQHFLVFQDGLQNSSVRSLITGEQLNNNPNHLGYRLAAQQPLPPQQEQAPENDEVQRAIDLSLLEQPIAPDATSPQILPPAPAIIEVHEEVDVDDEALQTAIQLSIIEAEERREAERSAQELERLSRIAALEEAELVRQARRTADRESQATIVAQEAEEPVRRSRFAVELERQERERQTRIATREAEERERQARFAAELERQERERQTRIATREAEERAHQARLTAERERQERELQARIATREAEERVRQARLAAERERQERELQTRIATREAEERARQARLTAERERQERERQERERAQQQPAAQTEEQRIAEMRRARRNNR